MTGLNELLQPRPIAEDRYRVVAGKTGWRRLYGGQVVAQALAAACLTVDRDRPCHSLHAYFLRPGAFDTPIDLEVSRDRDGRSFSARRVVASQNGAPILTMLASFHVDEAGLAHDSDRMPDVPEPEGLPTIADKARARGREPPKLNMLDHIDVRPIAGGIPYDPDYTEATAMFWFRFPEALPDDPVTNQLLLAYASDLFVLNTAVQPHRSAMTADVAVASLDHSIWFHSDAPCGQWMLYVQESPWAGRARGLGRGYIFARDGRHLASVAQEGLIRLGLG